MYQVQGPGERVVAMVLKELPGRKASGEGHALLTATSKCAHHESRPLLSPSIDDFLSESRNDSAPSRPLTSSAAVLSTDLVDLSDPRDVSMETRSARPEEAELIQVEELSSCRTPERLCVDAVSVWCPGDRWEELELEGGGASRCSSHHSSSELLWSVEFKSEKSCSSSTQDGGSSVRRRRTPSLPTKNESQEDEFVRAKAAVESDTEFWDKMEAEWEELARRNWLDECEGQRSTPPPGAPADQGYRFSADNPFGGRSDAFAAAQERARDGDLNAAVLLLEAAILQRPGHAQAWQLLGTTQAENENEQAAIQALQRCLELHPANLPALMALAVSFTNGGKQREACDVLRRWIRHNPRYQNLDPWGPPLQAEPGSAHRSPPLAEPGSAHSCELQSVLSLFQAAVQQNLDSVDPDLQTGLGVLYNLSCDFDKAVEAFTSALCVRPQDYLLWNRLGATLANGRRGEEALQAYGRALELQPGFIRSRYNLGVTCINLGAHREAVVHFLLALNQQRRSQRCSHALMSANIWAGLRAAVAMMDRPELVRAAGAGDLDLLTRLFEVGDV